MYQVGAVVDGFELTESGDWVRLAPTAGSPYRLGDVVDGHMLDADLTWVPLRRAPVAPYVPGDVVDEHVLTPDGEWVPLASRLRTRAGSATAPSRPTSPAPAAALSAGEPSAAARAARRAEERRLAGERAAADRRAVAQEASAEHRALEQRARDARAAAARAAERTAARSDAPTPARRTYRVGDVVNGHVLTPDHRWVPVTGGSQEQPREERPRASSAPGRSTTPPRRSGVSPLVPLVAVGFVVLQAVRACGG